MLAAAGRHVALDRCGVGASLQDHLQIRHDFGVSGAATLNTVCGSKSGLRLGVYQKAQRKTKSLHPTAIAL